MDGVTTRYTLNGTQVLAQQTGTDAPIYFTYDANGRPYSMTYGDTTVYYLCNLSGDVFALLDADGKRIVEYTYGPFGQLLGIYGSAAATFGTLNPLRYRGYYYDAETGLYYLNSRYYDPEVGRFINADDVDHLGADGSLLGYNLFAYCMNNPVNRFDEDGNFSLPNWAKITIGAVALAGAIALTVVTGGGAAAIAVGVAKIVGSVVLSTAVSAGAGYLKNGKQGAVDGACNGFMFGSLSALGGAALKYAKVHSATTGSPNSMGKAGERMAGIDQSAKEPIHINGRTRIPDAMTDTTLTEVKM